MTQPQLCFLIASLQLFVAHVSFSPLQFGGVSFALSTGFVLLLFEHVVDPHLVTLKLAYCCQHLILELHTH